MARTYTYKALAQERIEIGYLTEASPEAVAQWLKENWREPEASIYGDMWRGGAEGKELLEYILVRRKHPLIDYALARYGYSTRAIQTAYDRGNASTRYAALSNPRGGIGLSQSGEILRTGKPTYLSALLQNKYLDSGVLADLLYRKSSFSDVDDDRLMEIIFAVQRNERFRRPYKSLVMDGYDEYKYQKVFSAVWDLTKTVPANQHWAGALSDLIGNCNRPSGFDGLTEAMARWDIDEPVAASAHWHSRSPSFFIRSMLADFCEANQDLANSDDAARRASFYKRFYPWKFKEWPEYLNKDGNEFVYWALQNVNLWRDPDQRSKLRKLCWAADDPQSRMELPNDYNVAEERHQQQNPSWFAEKVDDPVKEEITSVKEEIAELRAGIHSLANQLFQISERKRGFFS